MSLDPNRYAAAAEAAFLQGELPLDNRELETIRARLQRARSAKYEAEKTMFAAQAAVESTSLYVFQLEQQEFLVEERIRHSRALLNPLRRLPDEILAIIFQYRLEDAKTRGFRAAKRVPLELAAVCRRWWFAACRSPRLWSFIVVDWVVMFPGRDPKHLSSHISMFVQRSQNHPVTLYFALSDQVPRSPTNDVWKILNDVAPRVIDITVQYYQDTDLPDSVLGYLRGRHLGGLKRLCLAGAFDEAETSPLFNVLDHKPNLRSPHLSDIDLAWDSAPVLPHLTQVYMGNFHEHLTASDVARIVSHMPNIEKLEWYLEEISGTNSNPPVVIDFPHLRTFLLACALTEPVDYHLRLPAADRLIIHTTPTEDSSIANDFMTSALHAPSLRYFQFTGDVEPGPFTEGIRAMPLLEELEFYEYHQGDVPAIVQNLASYAHCCSPAPPIKSYSSGASPKTK
ncbi:hypothetical protein EXIGLDRAFT_697823 [Exidia glandulosa HHB12029]|uniref:Uncharacterized protein n=1 Tax=Exidia glandulosa HHB12029 TaxID=1314781 RepID=A0A165EKI9_EXIGL|nr:hypothetical protein EXIGLDRAFT_697823 [Exidia glandulosa HHB12029]